VSHAFLLFSHVNCQRAAQIVTSIVNLFAQNNVLLVHFRADICIASALHDINTQIYQELTSGNVQSTTGAPAPAPNAEASRGAIIWKDAEDNDESW
jgi:hypothetical protein